VLLGAPYAVGLSSAVLKGTVVSMILAVMPLFLAVKAARLVPIAELYLAMAVASAARWSSVLTRLAGARWMAAANCEYGST
jgi:hypothetical protein